MTNQPGTTGQPRTRGFWIAFWATALPFVFLAWAARAVLGPEGDSGFPYFAIVTFFVLIPATTVVILLGVVMIGVGEYSRVILLGAVFVLVAVSLSFPPAFIVTLPAVLLSGLVLMVRERRRERRTAAGRVGLGIVAGAFVGFAGGAASCFALLPTACTPGYC